ncbi:bifunctional adenosylcobinamide kinase/adenosylcobinamide-phosphate guanylyltransferase [Anaeromassilibacillus senegalensis]|uniref:bifunctional adenosylcobinamide kinase/adenosylcobinamide-phosphate guanylyltransferase n=1 Tax=Anaeromassilibacillus senegalensis TaxID=1673717 RepID=UPI000681F315|nr:bifunctional adenosylcobinamide kinase/adenosylcobinamide-phosphate guanylyltransferase [Anaeromassilibacillus senegalensis]
MHLVIGGAKQGKLQWVLQEMSGVASQVAYTCDEAKNMPIWNALHEEIRRLMLLGQAPGKAVEQVLFQNPEITILCDEIGCGIVPVDAFEREWREQTGRICCMLAQRAERVDRVFCGIAACIKPEAPV